MESLRQYVVSVTAAAIVCGIVLSLLSKSSSHGILKMLCGLFLAFTVMKPITQIDMDELISNMSFYHTEQAEEAVAIGEEITRDSLADIITAETEAYILDKAEALDVVLQVDVTLSREEPPVPDYVTLRGAVTPYAKQQLTLMIAEELGIAKENQQWIG